MKPPLVPDYNNHHGKRDCGAAHGAVANIPKTPPARTRKVVSFKALGPALLLSSLLAGCNFAPRYSRPAVATTPEYKETSAAGSETNIWRVAQPSDAHAKGSWWESFDDPVLNELESKVAISNQTVVAAFQNFLSARAIAKEARAQLFPSLVANPSITRSRQNLSRGGSSSGGGAFTTTDAGLPLDASWQLDLWGRVRNTIRADVAEAQASAADLENTKLSTQAELASDYFQVQAQDALAQLFSDTVAAYTESLRLNQVRYETGIASDEDVAQAETQLQTAKAQATNLGILRAQMEHAIAVLIGEPPAAMSLPVHPLTDSPPPIPEGIPSQLLERRPDIAGAERRVAEANAFIGVAKAAYFPNVTLSAAGGLQNNVVSSLFQWSSRTWSIGAGLSETVFDAGLRRATVQQYLAAYNGTVARYRQTVLSAFQQVEDNVASLRILAQQVHEQSDAVDSARRYLDLANERYKLGIDSYLNVISAQTILLGNRQTLVNLRMQQMSAAVRLIEALGGGWQERELPNRSQVLSRAH